MPTELRGPLSPPGEAGGIDSDLGRERAAFVGPRVVARGFVVALIGALALLAAAAGPTTAREGGGPYAQKGGVAKPDIRIPNVRDHRGPNGKPGGGVRVKAACKVRHCHTHF